jgi:hypothetical protein
MKFLSAVLLTALHLFAANAHAQTVWRCGADGRTFSNTPCPGGQSTNYAVARPDSDLASAQARATREQKLADSLTQERRQREAAARGTGLGGFVVPKAEVKPAAKALAHHKRKPHRAGHQPADDDIWRATVPASQRTKG